MLHRLGRAAPGRWQNKPDDEADGSPGAQTDGDTATEAVPDAGKERSLQKYSLKLEDMGSGALSRRSADGWRVPFRRSRTPPQQARAPLQKTYSQYNLTQLGSTVAGESHHKPLHGIYGLLARHIEVPQSVLEQLQLQPPSKAAEQAGYREPRWGASSTREQNPPRRRCRLSLFLLPLLHPYSPAAVIWRCVMLLFDLTFTAFWVPLNVGFCFKSYGDLGRSCTRSDLAGGVVYVINWIMGFQMGVVATSGSRRMVLQDGIAVARVYIMYGKFVMDTLAVVPFFVLISAVASPHDEPVSPGRRLWSLLALLRLVRLLRLFNTVKVVYSDSINGQYRSSWVARRISVTLMFLIILGYQFLVVINLCASLMVLLGTFYAGQDGGTWFDGMPWVDFDAASPPMMWFHSAYWVITVLTTTGQGQAPRKLGEQIVANFCSMYGMVFNGLVVGVVGETLMRASGDASALLRSRRNVTRASAWASMRHLRPSLTRDLQVFFADSELAHREAHLARRDFNKEATYIEDLPTSLRRTVLQHIVEPLLSKVPFLGRMDPELRGLLASMFRPMDVPPNHDLCRQGTAADRLWVVEWGTVVALRHKETEAHPTTGMVCLLGETVLLRGMMETAAMRPWTFRTTSVCRLWELHWADMERLLAVEPSLVGDLMQYVRERLILKLDEVSEHDYSWCELVEVLGRTLKQPAMLDIARDNLEALIQSRVDDDSLPLLLSAWLEASIATSLELGLGAALGRKRDLVTMSLLMARRSIDTGGSGGPINSYGSGFQYPPLAAPPLTTMSRYGTGARGGSGAATAAASGVLASMSSSPVRGPLAPASPLGIVPSASPALLVRQPSDGAGDAVNPAFRSPGPSWEVPPGWLLSAPGASGGAGEAEPGADEDVAGTAAAAAPPPPYDSLSQPQVSLPLLGGGGSSGGGRAAPARSRFASVGPARRIDPWVEAVSTAAAARTGVGSRRASRRASLSDSGAVDAAARRRGEGGDGGWDAGLDPHSGGPTDTDTDTDAGAESNTDRESNQLSAIAHTSQAYAVVDAGGLPAAPPEAAPPPPLTHGSDQPDGQQQQEPQEAQQQQQTGLPSQRSQSRDHPTAGSTSSPQTLPDRWRTAEDASAGGGGIATAAAASAFLVRSGSSGGGSPQDHHPHLATGGRPRHSPASGGGGGVAGAVHPSMPSLQRARSAQALLPLVPEEGLLRSSVDGDGDGVGGRGHGGAPSPVAQPYDGRASAPSGASAFSSLRRGVSSLGPSGGGGGGAPGPFSALVPHRGVSRSRSASLLGQRHSSLPPPPPVVRAPSLARVREEGTTSGSGATPDCRTDGGDFTSAAAAAAASPSYTNLTQQQHHHHQDVMSGLDPRFSTSVAALEQTIAFGQAAAATADNPPPLPPLPAGWAQARISAVSSTAVATAAAVAAGLAAGGEISGAPISDRLLQLPLPDRVSKLRGRAGPSPVTRSVSLGNPDPVAWPHSPVAAAAAAAGGGGCPVAALCVTCGKCTCAVCRARALAAAQAVERSTAVVVMGAALGGRAPQPSRQAAARHVGARVSRPSFELPRAAAGAAAAAATAAGSSAAGLVYGNGSGAGRPPGAAAPWARGGGGAAARRGPETWRRRRVSMVVDLSMPSVPLVPY